MNDVTLLFDASEQGSGNTLCLEFQNDVFMFAQLFIGLLCLYLSPQHRENIKSIFHSKEVTFATLEYVLQNTDQYKHHFIFGFKTLI